MRYIHEPGACCACTLLHELEFPVHRLGYSHLIIAITRYAKGDMPSLTKDLYPYVARRLGYHDWHAVERTIRYSIKNAWANGDPQIWSFYFPRCKKAPSNKYLIATLAEQVQQNTPPGIRRG